MRIMTSTTTGERLGLSASLYTACAVWLAERNCIREDSAHPQSTALWQVGVFSQAAMARASNNTGCPHRWARRRCSTPRVSEFRKCRSGGAHELKGSDYRQLIALPP